MIKKITSLLMAVAIILTMSLTAFASSKVEKIEDGVFIESIGYTTGSKFDTGAVLIAIDGDYLPGDTINIFLDPSKITGDGIDFNAKTGMSAKELERAGVTFKFSSGKNSDVIKDVSFKEKTVNGNQVALIQVKLVENLSSTESKDFEVKLTLYANKVKQQDIILGGTVGSSVITVESGESFISLANGEILEPKENITDIEVDAGKDVSLFAKLFKGKKYYAVASDTPTDSDLDILNSNEALEMVYYLDTQGFVGSDVSVKIKTPEKLFVYGADGKALGTTDDRLALSTKYYLANKEVEFNLGDNNESETSDDLTDTDGITPIPGDEAGGSSDIPDTGVGIMPTVAVTGVVVSAAVIGILIITGKKKRR